MSLSRVRYETAFRTLGILKFQLLQPLDLVQFLAAMLLPPPVASHLGHPDLPDRFGCGGTLGNKDIDQPQLGENLIRRGGREPGSQLSRRDETKPLV